MANKESSDFDSDSDQEEDIYEVEQIIGDILVDDTQERYYM